MNLVALSGGYDSTAALALLLSRGEPCTVHHVCLTNIWHDEKVESRACETIVACLARRYRFEYSTSRLEYMVPGWVGQDNIQALSIIMSEAERMVSRNSELEVRMCFGFNRDDGTFPALAPRFQGMVDAFFCHLPPHIRRPELSYPLIGMSKSDLLALIPDELLDVCITCPQPINGKPCGKCYKCGLLARASAQRRVAA
jgi:7-cyano-7-deazaguanine synthase in queuosine biosynthesis